MTSEFPPQPGGIGNHAYNLALYLSKNGYGVSVIADQRAKENNDERKFDKSLDFNVHRIVLRGFRPIMYCNRIFKTIKAYKQTDYVIATGKFSLWNVAFCSLFFKRSKLAVIHGTEVNFKLGTVKKAVDVSLKKFDTIVAVSNYTKQLINHLKMEVIVIPNGIAMEEWQIDNVPKTTLKGHPVLTTVGRVSTRKGQLNVIKLLPDLLKTFPKLQYHCIGIPTEADNFVEHARALGVYKHVNFHGAVSDSELKSMLLATNVFVMVSSESPTGDVEGFGIAILEANALGIPSIGSKNCGIEDAILDGKSGFLISGDSFSEFKTALSLLLESQDFYKNEAIAWAKMHSWDEIIKRYISVIEA